jgi:hypothetical protein
MKECRAAIEEMEDTDSWDDGGGRGQCIQLSAQRGEKQERKKNRQKEG